MKQGSDDGASKADLLVELNRTALKAVIDWLCLQGRTKVGRRQRPRSVTAPEPRGVLLTEKCLSPVGVDLRRVPRRVTGERARVRVPPTA